MGAGPNDRSQNYSKRKKKVVQIYFCILFVVLASALEQGLGLVLLL